MVFPKKLVVGSLAFALALLAIAPKQANADNTPAVSVSDQIATLGHVVVDKVVAAQDGWIVIHAGDKDGTVLGYAPVKTGENDKVVVDIDFSKATPTVSAMLHIDAGTAGVYEFPGADVPVKDDAGKVINVPFKIAGVDVDDQFVKDTQAVNIANIVAQVDGWIVIHAGDKDGTVLGYSPIKAGLNSDVTVKLTDVSKVTPMMTAMIHIDAGTAGTYEFPGADVPVKYGDAISNEPFWTVDHVRVMDQQLADDGTFTIPYVLASVDGWIVIHSTAQGGPVIGYAPVKAGLNEGVKVKIDDPKTITDQVSAMLHIDAGTAGKYEFPGADGPVKDTDGKVIAPLFSTKGAMPMMEMTPMGTMPAMDATMEPTAAK